VSEGLKLAMERAKAHGTATLVIGDSHHVGALAAYLPEATEAGFVVSIASSSPSGAQVAQRMIKAGTRYEHPWVMDAKGNLSDDPETLSEGGTLLPTGGLDHGQKGYGMALSVEALTQGLAGYGRADAPKGTNAAVTINAYDPKAFGGGRPSCVRPVGWSTPASTRRPAMRPGPCACPGRRPWRASAVRASRAWSVIRPSRPGCAPRRSDSAWRRRKSYEL